MKIEIAEDKKNPFLKRRELLVKIDHEGEATPSFNALEQFIIKQTKADPEKLEILDIYSAKGAATAKSRVHIWDEKKIEKKKPKEEKKEEEPKKEEKQEAKKGKKEEEKRDNKKDKEAKKDEVKKEGKKEEKQDVKEEKK